MTAVHFAAMTDATSVALRTGRPPVAALASGLVCGALIAFVPSVDPLPYVASARPALTVRLVLVLIAVAVGMPVLVRLAWQGDRTARVAVAFTLWAALAALVSGSPLAWTGEFASGTGAVFVGAVAGCWAIGRALPPAAGSSIAVGFLAGAAVNAAVAVLQGVADLSGADLPLFHDRSTGLLGNPVFLGAACAAAMAFVRPVLRRLAPAGFLLVALLAAAVQMSGARAAFVLLVWSVVCDDRPALPWAVAAGSYALQCHVGYGLLVGGLGLVAVAWAVRRRWWQPLLIAGAVGVVLWIPPVAEQLGADDDWSGNLAILYEHFSTPDQPVVGLSRGFDAFAGELNVAGPWLVGQGHQPSDPPSWPGFVAMVALWAGAAAVAWRRRFDRALRLHAVLAIGCGLGLVSMARVFGDFFDYVIRWMWVLTTLVAVAVAWTAWQVLPDRWRRPAAGAGVAALAVAVASASIGAADAESSGPRNSTIVAALAPALERELDPDGTYLVRWDDTISLGATGVGVMLELEKRGFTVVADEFQRAAVLPHRVIEDECDADEVVYVVVGPSVDDVAATPGAREVAVVDPRTPEERRRFDEVAAAIDADL